MGVSIIFGVGVSLEYAQDLLLTFHARMGKTPPHRFPPAKDNLSTNHLHNTQHKLINLETQPLHQPLGLEFASFANILWYGLAFGRPLGDVGGRFRPQGNLFPLKNNLNRHDHECPYRPVDMRREQQGYC